MRSRRITKKESILGGIALFLLVLLFLYAFGGRPSVRGLLQNGSYGTKVELDTSFVYASQKYTGGVAVFGKEGVQGISNSGRVDWKIDFPVTDPILSCSGRYILAAARGGNAVKLITGGRVVQSMETDGAILTASVNKKGAFTLVTEERGYKGKLQVFSRKGETLYTWHSAEQNILAAAVCEDNKRVAVSLVNMSDMQRVSVVYQFDMREASPRVLDVGNENLVSALVYNGKELACIGDEALYYFKADGKEGFCLSYGGRELQKYSFHPGNILALGFWGGQADASTTVELYDTNGNLKGSCPTEGALSGMDTFGSYTLASTQNALYVIDRNGKIVTKAEVEHGISRVFLSGSRNRMFILYGAWAGMYIV